MSETMSPASITATATARRNEPKGSPSLRASTSAWWTAANTVAARKRPARINTQVSSAGTIWNTFSAARALASRGTAQAQAGMEAWCGDDIDPFRWGRLDCARVRRDAQFGRARQVATLTLSSPRLFSPAGSARRAFSGEIVEAQTINVAAIDPAALAKIV